MCKTRDTNVVAGRLSEIKSNLGQRGIAVVLNGNILYGANRPTCDDDGVFHRTELQGNVIFLDGGNGAIETADCADAIAHLQRIEHVLDLLVLLALRTDHQEVEDSHDGGHHNDHRKYATGTRSRWWFLLMH